MFASAKREWERRNALRLSGYTFLNSCLVQEKVKSAIQFMQIAPKQECGGSRKKATNSIRKPTGNLCQWRKKWGLDKKIINCCSCLIQFTVAGS